MALKVVQFTLVVDTATKLLSRPTFNNVSGAAMDPIPLIVKNEDATNDVWIGGPDVDTTHGQSLPPGGSVAMALYSNDVPYAYDASGESPIVSVMAGRQ